MFLSIIGDSSQHVCSCILQFLSLPRTFNVTSRLEQINGLVFIKKWVLLPPPFLSPPLFLLLPPTPLFIFTLILLSLFPPSPISSENVWTWKLWCFRQKPGTCLGWAVLSSRYLLACRFGPGLCVMHVEPLVSIPGEMEGVGGLTQFFSYVMSWSFITFFFSCFFFFFLIALKLGSFFKSPQKAIASQWW